jgi:hypothetical protein
MIDLAKQGLYTKTILFCLKERAVTWDQMRLIVVFGNRDFP